MKSQLWHDASEEPDKNRSLLLFDNGSIIVVGNITSDWEAIKSEYNFSKWVYVDSFVTKNKIELVDTELLLKEE